MKITKMGATALLAVCSAGLSLGQERQRAGIATEKSAERAELAISLQAKPADSTTTAATNSEVFQSIVIAAGQSYPINSTQDYTTAGTVAITVACTICTTSTTSMGTLGLVLQAAWAVPNSASYVVAENKAATAFLYTDAGAALFNVYGSQFRLILQNKGTQTIAIQQVTLFRHGQSTTGN